MNMNTGCMWLGLLVGGTSNNGANAGFSCSNTNNAPSNTNANIGSHLGFGILAA